MATQVGGGVPNYNHKPEDKPMTEKIYTKDDPCPFVKGEKICAGDSHKSMNPKRFYGFDNELDYPFIVYSNDARAQVESYRYAKKLRPELEVDAKVWVRTGGGQGWYRRHFREWSKVEGIMCFDSGQTSHSNNCGATRWAYYTLEDPNKHDCCKG